MTPGATSRVAAGLLAAAALQACGGAGAAKPPRIGPDPVETPAAALKRFTPGACDHAGAVMHGLHDGAVATKACRKTLAGLDLHDADLEIFRSGGVAALPGATLALALDTDRRWKVAFRGPSVEGGGDQGSADKLAAYAVSALRQENCHELTRYAFVYGGEDRWCARPRITGISADLIQNYGVKPRRLGGAKGLAFYGVVIPGGHYWTMVISDDGHGHWFYYDAYKAQ
jgi:hypothetical protein